VPEPYLFHSLGLALSGKQMPRFVGIIDSLKDWMELLEPESALKRQTLYPVLEDARPFKKCCERPAEGMSSQSLGDAYAIRSGMHVAP
jgi:hypothetical protein